MHVSQLTLCPVILFFYPGCQNAHGIFLFVGGKYSSLTDMVPFLETSAAAACRGMLCHEHGMAVHGRLFPVVGYVCRCKAPCNKVGGVPAYRVHAFVVDIFDVLPAEMKAASERRFRKACKKFLMIVTAHVSGARRLFDGGRLHLVGKEAQLYVSVFLILLQ